MDSLSPSYSIGSGGDQSATAEEILPAVYDELRKLAAVRLSRESLSQTLQPTALVHEAWLRLTTPEQPFRWNSRQHFFGAAAEAMRRILVERARHKQSLKAGGSYCRQAVFDYPEPSAMSAEELIALDDVLAKLEVRDARKASLVKLRFFAGLTIAEAAAVLGISDSTAENDWAYARCWLRLELGEWK